MSLRIPSGPANPIDRSDEPFAFFNRLFVQFLQDVFAANERGQLQWSFDQKLSEIYIGDQVPILREQVEKRPSIIVSRGPASFGNLTMDQHLSTDYATGKRTHTDLVSCAVTYNCLSRVGLEAQRVAWQAMMATRRLKRVLMKAGCHRVGEELTMGAESPPGSFIQGDPNEITMVQVTVPFYYQDFWTVEPEDKTLLTGINVALRSERLVPIRGPGMNGRPIQYEKSITLDTRVQATNKPKPKQ